VFHLSDFEDLRRARDALLEMECHLRGEIEAIDGFPTGSLELSDTSIEREVDRRENA
jgi:hypothetical protein